LGNCPELAKQEHQAELAIAITGGITLEERVNWLVSSAAEAMPNYHQSYTTKHSLLQAELVVGHLE
jgi:hypothetical protein